MFNDLATMVVQGDDYSSVVFSSKWRIFSLNALIGLDGCRFAEYFYFDPVVWNALGDEVVPCYAGSSFGEVDVVFGGSLRVGMSLNEGAECWVFFECFVNFIQFDFGLAVEGRFVEVEEEGSHVQLLHRGTGEGSGFCDVGAWEAAFYPLGGHVDDLGVGKSSFNNAVAGFLCLFAGVETLAEVVAVDVVLVEVHVYIDDAGKSKMGKGDLVDESG